MGKQGAPIGNQNAKKERERNKGNDVTFVSPGPLFDSVKPAAPTAKSKKTRGNSQAYLAATIKAKRPDIAAAVERGEYKSMRAAGDQRLFRLE